MLTLNKESFGEIRSWVYRNARQIDLAQWRYEFEGGNAEAVASALSYYQNEDGGFGNALEPDCWNPASSPYTTLTAIDKLYGAGLCGAGHPAVRGIIRFLESDAHRAENGWLFSIPSNNGYPRAPWWTYDPQANEYEHKGVTAGLCRFILENADRDSALYSLACSFVDKLLSALREPGSQGDMGLYGYIALMDAIKKLGLAGRFDISYLAENIKNLVDAAIERDVSRWPHYSVRPSQFIKSPGSPFYPGNEDIVARELDYLIETRPAGGVWGITWLWHDNYALYPKEFAISENWWMSVVAIERLKFLQNFGRLEKL